MPSGLRASQQQSGHRNGSKINKVQKHFFAFWVDGRWSRVARNHIFFVVPPRFFFKQNMAIFLGHFPADFCIECAGTVIYYFCSKVHPVDGGGAGAQHRQRCHTAGVLHLPKWGWGMRRSENVTYCRNSSLWDLWTMPLHQFCQSQLSFPNTLYRDRTNGSAFS